MGLAYSDGFAKGKKKILQVLFWGIFWPLIVFSVIINWEPLIKMVWKIDDWLEDE